MSDSSTPTLRRGSHVTESRRSIVVAIVLALGALDPRAHAEEVARTNPPEQADASDAASGADEAVVTPGDGHAALPAFQQLRIASERSRGFALRGLASYGLTESVGDVAGAHHRVGFSLGASAQPLRWFSVGVAFDGRFDRHPDDGAGHDSGLVTQTALEVRATPSLANGLSVGVAAALLGYGSADRAFETDALSFEASGLVSYRTSRLLLGAELGYRLDRSAAAAPAASVSLRPGDRLALGLSSYDALLVRLGASVRFGATDLYLEGALDALLGSGAPSFGVSPMHVALGVRHAVSDRLLLDGFVDVSPSQRPSLPNGGPYVRVDPRVTVGLALAYRYGGPRAAGAGDTGDSTNETRDPVDGTDVPDPSTHDPRADEGRTLSGLLLDARGEPLVDAHVVIQVGESRVEGYTDGEGRFTLEHIPDGEAVLHVEAVGHAEHVQELGRRSLSLPAEGLRLEEASAHGALRGVVLGFDGQPLSAEISITPGHHSARTDGAADGAFEITLPPGRYSVHVEARGYASQTRDVTLTDGGVTILNLELRRER